MINKLLSIKKDRNIIIYKVEFKEKELKDYLNYLDSIYGYEEKNKITALIFKEDRLLTAGRYDFMKKHCEVLPQFTKLEELSKFDDNVSNWKVEIIVHFYSKINKILTKTFMTKDKLINATELIKLGNHLAGCNNHFIFNKMLDINDDNKEWNDPSRVFLKKDEYYNYVKFKKAEINVDDVALNKFEEIRLSKDIDEIMENIQRIIKIEQIGMFPITNNPSNIEKIMTIFGERNKDFEYFYGSLENAEINLNASHFFNDIKDELCEKYDPENETIISRENDYYKKVKSFLKF